MILKIVSIAAFFIIVVSLPAASAAPVEIKTGVDKSTVFIGDKIIYTIEASSRKGAEYEFPEYKDEIGGLSIKDFNLSERNILGKKIVARKYILSTLEPGEYAIPSSTVKYRTGQAESWSEVPINELKIEVKSVLAGAKGAVDIRDIKGPVGMRDILLIIVLAAVIFAVAASLITAFLFTAHKAENLDVPPRPAHIIAYEALDELWKRDLIKKGMIKEFYIGLSGIARRYLENRFRLRAPEMTTEEFLIDVKSRSELTREQKAFLKDFMSHCDLVKFAKYGPRDDEIALSVDSAKRLIDQTKEEDAIEGKR